jgi:hypothetical protein
MPRSPVVALLVVALLLSGCATPPKRTPENSADAGQIEFPDQPPPDQGRSFGQWLSDHPWVKYGGIVVLVVGGIVLAGVVFVAAGGIPPALGT